MVTGLELTAQQITDVAAEAFVFGYPLVLMKVTRDRMTAVPTPQGLRAPVNRFGHVRAAPDQDRAAPDPYPTGPHADLLYSSAWLDLSAGPVVLSVPDTGGRYYLLPILDGWTNVVAAPGARTTGTGRADFAIVGPYWHGLLPRAAGEIRSPTEMAWIIGRTQVTGPADHDAVQAIQDGFTLTALPAWGAPVEVGPVTPRPGSDRPEATGETGETGDGSATLRERVARMDPGQFFGLLGGLMVDNAPRPADDPMVERMGRIGVLIGEGYDWASLDRSIRDSVARGARHGLATVEDRGRAMRGEYRDGWRPGDDLGEYGTDYLRRAAVAWMVLGRPVTPGAHGTGGR